LNEPAKLATA